MKNKLNILTITALASLLCALPAHAGGKKKAAEAAASPATATASPAAEAKVRKLPFRGKIASADKEKKTITLESKAGEGRVITITSDTKLLKSDTDVAATWDDLKVGEEVRGSYTKSASGALEAAKVKVGAKAPAAAASPEASPSEKKASKKAAKKAAAAADASPAASPK